MAGSEPIAPIARWTAGGFVAGAGIVGAIWVVLGRTPAAPPPEPLSFEIPGARLEPERAEGTANPSAPDPIDTTGAGGESAHEAPLLSDLKPTVIEAEDDEPTEPLPAVSIVRAGDEPGGSEPGVGESAPASPEADAGPGSAVRLINVNSAGSAELQLLPRIGPVLAQRIIDDRTENGPYASLEDLQRVKGIGPLTAERLAPMVTFD